MSDDIIELKTAGRVNQGVSLDGVELRNVRRVTFAAGVDQVAEVTLELIGVPAAALHALPRFVVGDPVSGAVRPVRAIVWDDDGSVWSPPDGAKRGAP